MNKYTVAGVAMAALITSGAMAQTGTPNAPSPSAPHSGIDNSASTLPGERAGQFLTHEAGNEWRASKLIGMSVKGPDDKSIGAINDLLVDTQGSAQGVVIGVGGFLGVGEKDVAVPFNALRIDRNPNDTIEKVSVNYTKQELKNAPAFKSAADRRTELDSKR